MQCTVTDGEIGPGRNDVEMVRLDRHSIRRLSHGHRRVACQQVHHHALVRRVEMLNQNEGHAVAGWQCRYELPAGIKSTGRCTYPDDQEVGCAAIWPGARG